MTDAADFGKVAVLMGGWSSEREISLLSGVAVTAALQDAGIDAHSFDLTRDSAAQLARGGFDRAFIVLHGCGGEDGAVQGLLEMLGIAYTGSGVAASAVCMNKLISKRLLLSHGLPTPGFVEAGGGDERVRIAGLGLPLAVKPVSEGSSVGVSKVLGENEIDGALHEAQRSAGGAFAEKWIEGDEYAIGFLCGEMLPPVRLEPARKFYDYIAKYQDDATQYHCPCGLPEDAEAELRELCRRACSVLGVAGWARVDAMRDRQGRFWLLEVNTVPGMTDHSLVPMAAQAAGISFGELVLEILGTSINRRDG